MPQGNPNIVAAWNKFKDKNFTILGVSLDRKKEPWLAAIEKDQLTWTHVSDLKDWKSGVSRAVCYSLDSYEFFVGPQWSDFGGRIGRRGFATKVGRSLEISSHHRLHRLEF